LRLHLALGANVLKTHEVGYTIDNKGIIYLACTCYCSLDSITCPILGCGFKTKSIQNINKHYVNLHENEDINEIIRILVDKYSLQYLDLKTDPKNKKRKLNDTFTDFGEEGSDNENSDYSRYELNSQNLENNEKENFPNNEFEDVFENVIQDFLNENNQYKKNDETELDFYGLENEKESETNHFKNNNERDIEFNSSEKERELENIEELIEDIEKNFQIFDEFYENEIIINKSEYFSNIKTEPIKERNIFKNDIDSMNITQKIILEEIISFNISKDNINEYLENKRILNRDNKDIPKNYYEISKLLQKIEILKPKIIEKSIVNF
jgi:hypothetical protein